MDYKPQSIHSERIKFAITPKSYLHNQSRRRTNQLKQDKYTLDPGRQIYLSNNKTKMVENDF